MLRSLSRTPTEHPTPLRDIDAGFENLSGIGFEPDAKEEARMEIAHPTFMTQDRSGPPSMEDSNLALDLGGGTLPWVNGLPGQFYPQDPLHLGSEQNTPDLLYGTNRAILASNFNWDDPEGFLDRTNATPPYVPERGIRNDDDNQQIFQIPSSTSTSTSNSYFPDLSQNRDIFSPSSASTPNSPSDESDPRTGFKSVAVPTLPSTKSDAQSSCRLSQISSIHNDKGASISCSNCSTNNTSLWRRDNEGLPICNACGLFMRLHGIPRPLSLKTDVVKKRKRDRSSGASTLGGRSGRTRTRASRTLARVSSISESERG